MALTTLANVKAFKNVTDEAHDDELTRLIPVVQDFIEHYCNRTLERGSVTEYHSTVAGQPKLLLRQPPVASITSIYDDPTRAYGASTLIPATDYVLEYADAGIVRFPTRYVSQGVFNIKITYQGGFTEAELAVLEQAAIELCWLAREKGDNALLGLSAKSVADGSVAVRNDWPSGVDALLEQFRLRNV